MFGHFWRGFRSLIILGVFARIHSSLDNDNVDDQSDTVNVVEDVDDHAGQNADVS